MTQTVVITGASAGIARATARLYGARGASVGLIARGQAGLDGAAEDVIEAGGQALAIPADVADHAQLEKAATEIEAQFGPIDVWINVAFTSVFAPFAQIAPDEFRRVTEVSYLGYVNGTMVALSRMRPRNAGTIVQVGSALSERAIPLQSAYCGAKHAINGFTESLRCELLHEHSNVRVTVVQMPAVNTPAVLLGAVPAAAPPPAGAADLPAGGRRARRRVRGRSSWAQAILGRREHGRDPAGAEGRAGDPGPLPGPDRVRRAADRPGGAGGEPAGQPVRPGRRGARATTTARTASSTTGRTREAGSSMRRIIRLWPAVSRPGLRWPARCWCAAWPAVRDACAARPDGRAGLAAPQRHAGRPHRPRLSASRFRRGP